MRKSKGVHCDNSMTEEVNDPFGISILNPTSTLYKVKEIESSMDRRSSPDNSPRVDQVMEKEVPP